MKNNIIRTITLFLACAVILGTLPVFAGNDPGFDCDFLVKQNEIDNILNIYGTVKETIKTSYYTSETYVTMLNGVICSLSTVDYGDSKSTYGTYGNKQFNIEDGVAKVTDSPDYYISGIYNSSRYSYLSGYVYYEDADVKEVGTTYEIDYDNYGTIYHIVVDKGTLAYYSISNSYEGDDNAEGYYFSSNYEYGVEFPDYTYFEGWERELRTEVFGMVISGPLGQMTKQYKLRMPDNWVLIPDSYYFGEYEEVNLYTDSTFSKPFSMPKNGGDFSIWYTNAVG